MDGFLFFIGFVISSFFLSICYTAWKYLNKIETNYGIQEQSYYYIVQLHEMNNVPSFLTEDTIDIVYRHLSYMLYNKVQVLQYLQDSFGYIPPDHIVDDTLYFENFHEINAQLERYPSKLWTSMLEEAFSKLYSCRKQFTTQITQMYFEHFNPTKMDKPTELVYKQSWPGWDVKFLNILEITQNIRKDTDLYRMFYTDDPLLSYNRCPCKSCNTDWNLCHNKLLSKMEEGATNDIGYSVAL